MLSCTGVWQSTQVKTEKLNNEVREALKYQRLRLFVLPFDNVLTAI